MRIYATIIVIVLVVWGYAYISNPATYLNDPSTEAYLEAAQADLAREKSAKIQLLYNYD